MGIARNFIQVKPTEGVLLLGEIMFELRQLWVRQCQALCSIVSIPSDVAFIGELPAQNAELILKQVFSPQGKKKNCLFLIPFFSLFGTYFVLFQGKMLFLKDI